MKRLHGKLYMQAFGSWQRVVLDVDDNRRILLNCDGIQTSLNVGDILDVKVVDTAVTEFMLVAKGRTVHLRTGTQKETQGWAEDILSLVESYRNERKEKFARLKETSPSPGRRTSVSLDTTPQKSCHPRFSLSPHKGSRENTEIHEQGKEGNNADKEVFAVLSPTEESAARKPIPITASIPVVVGRGDVVGLRDARLSKQHVLISPPQAAQASGRIISDLLGPDCIQESPIRIQDSEVGVDVVSETGNQRLLTSDSTMDTKVTDGLMSSEKATQPALGSGDVKHLPLTEGDRVCVVLEDHSSNGTFLNGIRLEKKDPTWAREGDIITLVTSELASYRITSGKSYSQSELVSRLQPGSSHSSPRRTDGRTSFTVPTLNLGNSHSHAHADPPSHPPLSRSLSGGTGADHQRNICSPPSSPRGAASLQQEETASLLLMKLKTEALPETLKSIRRRLKARSATRAAFRTEFFELDGTRAVLDVLTGESHTLARSALRQRSVPEGSNPVTIVNVSQVIADAREKQFASVKCLKAVLADRRGVEAALNVRHAVRRIVACLDMHESDLNARIMQILAMLVIYSSKGMEAVVDGLNHRASIHGESNRFDFLLNVLKREHSPRTLAYCLALINAIASSQESVHQRVETRKLLADCGFHEVAQSLRAVATDDMLTQLDGYQEGERKDEEVYENIKLTEVPPSRLTDPADICSALLAQSKDEECRRCLTVVMVALSHFPLKGGGPKWHEAERAVIEVLEAIKCGKPVLVNRPTLTVPASSETKSAEGKDDVDQEGGIVPSNIALPPLPTLPKATCPLRPLHWNKLKPISVANTIWMEKVAVDASFLDVEELTTQFGEPKKVVGEKHEGAQASSNRNSIKKKPDIVQLLDGQRSRNLGIMLSRFKRPPTVLKKMILTCDLNEFTEDELHALLVNGVPREDEKEVLGSYSGNPALLGPGEVFLLEMLGVPNLPDRLSTMILKKTFYKRIEEIKTRSLAISQACTELRSSTKLPEVLAFVLAHGNFMNSGTFRGNAYGFRLDCLLKLQDTRSIHGKTTLLHCLASALDKKRPAALRVADEMPHLEHAAGVSLADVETEARQLRSRCDAARALLERETSSPDTCIDDCFITEMQPFVEETVKLLTPLQSCINEARESFTALVQWFGEDTESTTTNAFFSLWMQFFQSIEKAHNDNEREKLVIGKRLEKEKHMKLKKHRSASMSPTGTLGLGAEGISQSLGRRLSLAQSPASYGTVSSPRAKGGGRISTSSVPENDEDMWDSMWQTLVKFGYKSRGGVDAVKDSSGDAESHLSPRTHTSSAEWNLDGDDGNCATGDNLEGRVSPRAGGEQEKSVPFDVEASLRLDGFLREEESDVSVPAKSVSTTASTAPGQHTPIAQMVLGAESSGVARRLVSMDSSDTVIVND
eukprot:Rmarinus@m.19366